MRDDVTDGGLIDINGADLDQLLAADESGLTRALDRIIAIDEDGAYSGFHSSI